MMQKIIETLAQWYLSKSTQQELSNEYQHGRVYNLSDSSLATAFSILLMTKRSSLPSNLANLFGELSCVCMNILFVSTPKNVDFALIRSNCEICTLPIVKM